MAMSWWRILLGWMGGERLWAHCPLFVPHLYSRALCGCPATLGWHLRLEHAFPEILPETGACCRWWSTLADFFCLFMGPRALVLSSIMCGVLGSSFCLVSASSGIQYLKKTVIPSRQGISKSGSQKRLTFFFFAFPFL